MVVGHGDGHGNGNGNGNERREMDSGRTPISRRDFVARSALFATAAAIPTVLGKSLRGREAPSERVTIGALGTGSHGIHRNLHMLLGQDDARVVAVCDVFADRRERARRMVDGRYGSKGCDSYLDFRRIIERNDIDAVMISTPDHWHVPMSVMALRAGKDVICEKPTLTIAEGRILSDLVAKRRAVFQTSTEDRSLHCYHRMAQIVRNGLIGKVRTVRVRLPDGTRYPDEKPAPVPEGLDYDLWLGPAPEAPYTPNRLEKMHWRHIFDYSGGILTDWGLHQLDTVQWALDTERTGPVEVEGEGTVNEDSLFNTFVTYTLRYKYASGVVLHVENGGTGMRFEGDDGWVGNAQFAGPVEASSEEIAKWTPGEGDVALPTNHAGEHRSFLDAVRERKDPYFPAEFGHRCSTICHMGNIAMLLERKLRWDPEAERFIDDDRANSMRSRPMRAPWSLEA